MNKNIYKLTINLEKADMLFHSTVKYVQGVDQVEYIRERIYDAAYVLGLGNEISIQTDELPLEDVKLGG